MDPITRRLLKRLALACGVAALAYWLAGAALSPAIAVVAAVLGGLITLALSVDADLRDRVA